MFQLCSSYINMVNDNWILLYFTDWIFKYFFISEEFSIYKST